MQKKTVLMAIGLVALLVIFFFIYRDRGGFAKPSISLGRAQTYIIAGKSYRGKATDPALKSVFKTTHEFVKQGTLKGTFTICFYGNPDQVKDSIEVFTGVIVTDATAPLPKGYELRTFPERDVIRAEVNAHVSVAPAAEEVNLSLRTYADSAKVKLGNFYMEKYINERNIVTEVPLLK